MIDQVLNVSQFYQTIIMIGLLGLFILETVICCLPISPHIEKQKDQHMKQQIQWERIKSQVIDPHKEIQQDLAQEIKNQMMRIDSVKDMEKANQNSNIAQYNQQPNNQQHATVQVRVQESTMNNQLSEKKQQNQNQTENKTEKQELNSNQKILIQLYLGVHRFADQHVPIITCILTLGILMNSVYIFSLACYFCHLFCNIIFDFIRIEQKLKQQYKKGIVTGKLVKLLSGCFIIAIFVSYWIIVQF